jgi:Serine/Threonine/Tyrosine Kinase found in polyvalent proteins
VPYIREATPLEYLSRLQLFNRTFRDLIEVVGVIDQAGKEAIVTSQPRIKGGYADDEQVKKFMESRKFVMVQNVVAGRRNSVSYFREADRVAVFDTHGQNFLVSGARTGPIDALIITADDDLTAFLSMSPEERRDEIGKWTSQIHGFD